MISRDEFIYTGRVTARKEDSRFRLAQLTGATPTVLDAGCAVGYIGEFLRMTPPARWLAGIELDPRAAEQARPHYDQLIVGSLEDAAVWGKLEKQVDAMIFGDVLEHTSDPVRVLQLALPHLNKGGIVIVSMPNIAHFRVRLRLLVGRFEYEEWGIMDRTHLRFFTLATAKKMLNAAGLDVLHTEAILAFPAADGGGAAHSTYRAARARARSTLGAVWPTLFAKQFILVGARPGEGDAKRTRQFAAARS